jgi:hypothetical protein
MVADERRLTRQELAEFLSARGFKISRSTLAKLAMRKAGPPPDGFWGTRLLYDPSKALRWAQARFRVTAEAA